MSRGSLGVGGYQRDREMRAGRVWAAVHTSDSIPTFFSDSLGAVGLCSVLVTPVSLFLGCCVTQAGGPPLSERLAVTSRSHEL